MTPSITPMLKGVINTTDLFSLQYKDKYDEIREVYIAKSAISWMVRFSKNNHRVEFACSRGMAIAIRARIIFLASQKMDKPLVKAHEDVCHLENTPEAMRSWMSRV